MNSIERNLNAILAAILSGVLLSAYWVQFMWKEIPCPLCMLQRLGMLGIASGALLNVRFGIKTSHYGLMICSCLMGGFVALRQISLHVCPGFPQFGLPVFGISLYTWSFFVFVSALLYIAILLFLYNPLRESQTTPPLNLLHKLSLGLVLLITFANILTVWMQCGFGPCAE